MSLAKLDYHYFQEEDGKWEQPSICTSKVLVKNADTAKMEGERKQKPASSYNCTSVLCHIPFILCIELSIHQLTGSYAQKILVNMLCINR